MTGTSLWVVVFLGFAALEIVRPWRAAASDTVRRWVGNLALYALSMGLDVVAAPTVTAVAALALPLDMPDIRLPAGLHLLAAIAALDLASYAVHRLEHRLQPLWRLHAVHHSDPEVDVTTTVRHHPLEALALALVIGLLAALVGIRPTEIAIYGSLVMCVQIAGHANVALPPRLMALLGTLLVTPTIHRTHHSRQRCETDSNYGQLFSIWDRLFGTLNRPVAGREEELEFGLDDFRETRFQRLDRLLVQPLAARRP